MILDKNLFFSDGQTVSATADSTNTLDLGAGKINGSNLTLVCTAASGTGSGTITVELKSCATASGSFTSHASTGALTGSTLTNNKVVYKLDLPENCERYVKLAFTVANTASAKFTAYLAQDVATVL